MVQKGDFSIELIDAQTKDAFQEHSGSENAVDDHCVDSFVEVEPGSEYYIRVANDSPSMIICNITVDGNDLGYEFCLGPNEYDDKGLWRLQNGESLHTAFKVDKAAASGNPNNSNSENSEMGVVTVDFFEYIEGDGTEKANNFESNWTSETSAVTAKVSGCAAADCDKKRKVKSQQGSHSEKLSNDDGERKVYSYGEGIESVRLKYCTAVGLIVEGVLPKPPLWDWARMTQPVAQNLNPKEIINATPKIFKRNICDHDGKVIEEKDVEMFDLTTLDDE